VATDLAAEVPGVDGWGAGGDVAGRGRFDVRQAIVLSAQALGDEDTAARG